MILVAVQFNHVDIPLVGRPADVGEITVSGVACLQINGSSGLHIIYSHRHFMARHACHRVFVRLQRGDARGGVHLRIVRHHALVHPVKCKIAALRAPISAFPDAELIAVDCLPIDHIFLCIRRTAHGCRVYHFAEIALACHKQAVARRVGQQAVRLAEVHVGGAFPFRRLYAEHVGQLLLPEVIPEHVVLIAFACFHFPLEHHDLPVAPRHGCLHQREERLDFMRQRIRLFPVGQGFVDFVQRDQHGFFPGLRIDGPNAVHVGTDAFVAPPLQP